MESADSCAGRLWLLRSDDSTTTRRVIPDATRSLKRVRGKIPRYARGDRQWSASGCAFTVTSRCRNRMDQYFLKNVPALLYRIQVGRTIRDDYKMMTIFGVCLKSRLTEVQLGGRRQCLRPSRRLLRQWLDALSAPDADAKAVPSPIQATSQTRLLTRSGRTSPGGM